MNPKQTSLERALEEAVSRALRDNLAPLQRTADELHQAYADLVAACASTRPSNALPAMLRAQTAAAALSAGLSVLSNFVASALHPRESGAAPGVIGVAAEEPDEFFATPPVGGPTSEIPLEVDGPTTQIKSTEVKSGANSAAKASTELLEKAAKKAQEEPEIELIAEPQPQAAATPVPAVPDPAHEVPTFDIAALPVELQDLHRRANRVAKVTMQDIKLLRPKDVESGREHKDICERLRVDLDKARKEYDRRFRAISEHPVDYFHHWMLEFWRAATAPRWASIRIRRRLSGTDAGGAASPAKYQETSRPSPIFSSPIFSIFCPRFSCPDFLSR